jgi:hypothetical protein
MILDIFVVVVVVVGWSLLLLVLSLLLCSSSLSSIESNLSTTERNIDLNVKYPDCLHSSIIIHSTNDGKVDCGLIVTSSPSNPPIDSGTIGLIRGGGGGGF